MIVAFFQSFSISNSVSSDRLDTLVQASTACHHIFNVGIGSSLAPDSFIASFLDFSTCASLRVWIEAKLTKKSTVEVLSSNCGITCFRKSSHNFVSDQSSLKYGFNQLTVVLNNTVQMNCLSSSVKLASFNCFTKYSFIVRVSVFSVQSSLVVLTSILFLNHLVVFNQNLDFFSQKSLSFFEVIHNLSQIVNAISQVLTNTDTVSLIGFQVVWSTISLSTVLVFLIGVITFFQLEALIFGAMKFNHSSKDIHAVLNEDFINAAEVFAILSASSLFFCLFLISFITAELKTNCFQVL